MILSTASTARVQLIRFCYKRLPVSAPFYLFSCCVPHLFQSFDHVVPRSSRILFQPFLEHFQLEREHSINLVGIINTIKIFDIQMFTKLTPSSNINFVVALRSSLSVGGSTQKHKQIHECSFKPAIFKIAKLAIISTNTTDLGRAWDYYIKSL